MSFVVALNAFPDAPAFDEAELRQALDIDDGVALLTCDARDRASVRQVLIALVEHVLVRRRAIR